MKLVLLCIVIVGLCVFLLCFNIIFRKDGKFPDTEIEHNLEMRKRGIQCAKIEEKKLWGKKNRKAGSKTEAECNNDCGSCAANCN
ncbi:MAG: hypothetical protein IKD16_03725 [Bacteroidales bacterium]|nr:hypothetical protein [Bacteroidales bacterium]